MSKQLSIEELISRSAEIHGTKYDYSLVNYVNKDTKVKIICQIHGIFLQNFAAHIRKKCGCPSCSIKKKLTTEEFIDKCKLKHGNLYDYSLVNYINATTKVKIICKKHGIFEQNPKNHSCTGYGCPKCTNKNKTKNEIINDFNITHNYEYDYSLMNYKKSNIKIKIICSKHGIFEQTPNGHLSGTKCPKCSNVYVPTTEEFISKVKLIHNNVYDYSLVKYENNRTPIRIICSKHGEFLQRPANHLNGQGCQKCSESHGEKLIRKFLTENNLLFIYQHRFKDCRDKNPLPFDFYLPELNTCIEFDGVQHYEPVDRFGGESELLNVQRKDNIKTHYCLDNGIKLIRIRYDEDINEKLEFILYNYIKFTSSTKN